MKGFFFKSVGVPRGSPELGKGIPAWVPSGFVQNAKGKIFII